MSLVMIVTSKSLRCEGKLSEAEQRSRMTKHRESALMYYVNALSILGGFATHVLSHLEPLLNGKRERAIHDKFNTINNIFVTKLNFVPDFKAKRSKYIKQTVALCLFVSVLSVASSFAQLPELYHDKYFMQPMLIFPILINRFRWCYMAMLLHHIGDILNDLHILLKQHQIQSRDESSAQPGSKYARENIRYYREIYSNVWFVITLLSDCFGWSFIFFLVEFTFEMINGAYWLYINLTVYGSIALNIRKFRSVFKVSVLII